MDSKLLLRKYGLTFKITPKRNKGNVHDKNIFFKKFNTLRILLLLSGFIKSKEKYRHIGSNNILNSRYGLIDMAIPPKTIKQNLLILKEFNLSFLIPNKNPIANKFNPDEIELIVFNDPGLIIDKAKKIEENKFAIFLRYSLEIFVNSLHLFDVK